METAVHSINVVHRKPNTKAAYDPKMAEYEQYCDYKFNYEPAATRYTVTGDKVFEFLFYHAMRNKYSVGGPGKKTRNGFQEDDFEHVMGTYKEGVKKIGELRDAGTEIDDATKKKLFKDPENPLRHQQVNTYKATLLKIFKMQVQKKANSLTWEQVFTYNCEALVELVKNRSPRIARENFHEKIQADFTPFTSIGQVTEIEQKFWENGAASIRKSFPSIRNRMTFLNCYSGLLRHESMFLGELSDMVGLEHEKEGDAHKIFIMVMQIAIGKWLVVVLLCVWFD